MRLKIIFLFLSFLIIACQTVREAPPSPQPIKEDLKSVKATAPFPSQSSEAASGEISLPSPSAQKSQNSLLVLQKGTAPSSKIAKRSLTLRGVEKINLEINLEGADLLDFLQLLFQETLHQNYAVDPSAKAKVTVHIKGRFSKTEILDLIQKVLELHNLTLINKGGIYRIIPVSKLGNISGQISFFIFRPKYLQAENLSKVVKTLASVQAKLIIDKATNSIILVDIPGNINKVIGILNLLDENILANMYLALYRPKVLEAETLTEYLKAIFKSSPLKSQNIDQYVDFIPLKEINAILIVARNSEGIDQIYRWLKEIDSGELVEKEVFIYQVENGDAEEIAQILQDTFYESTSSNRKTIIKAKKGKQNISGEIRIIPDKTNNLLIIKATKQDYLTIRNLLKKIDVTPRQVVIEMLITEITLNKELEYGVEWFLKNQLKLEGKPYEGHLILGKENTSPASIGNITGFTYALYRKGDLRALISALESVSQINILSSPVILATDNKEAKIQIGQEVPIITQQVTNTSASEPNITSTVQYRDTGIILTVKPHINSSGLVKLDIVQEISSAQKNYLGLENTPLIIKRKIETSLVVKNNQTVILGGLIDNRKEIGETGVPILKNIPGLGNLFRWRKNTRDRTELLVAITPRVVRTYQEAELVMQEFKTKIEDLKRRLAK